jgi:hypothetical protein
MEESVADIPENVLLSFLSLQVSASGRVAFVVGAAVALLIVALAWRLVRR